MITKVNWIKGGGRASWHHQRQVLSGIGDPDICRLGASEVSIVCGVNKYESEIKLFYNKLGLHITHKNSERLSAGLAMEPVLNSRYKTFDIDRDKMAKNMEEGIENKKTITPKFFALNDKYPRMFSSMDMLVAKNQASYFTGEIIPFSYPLEFKNVTYDSFQSWKGEPYKPYVLQNNIQQMMWNVDYGELFVLVDGWESQLFPIERSIELCQFAEYRVQEFTDRVIAAKPYVEMLHEGERTGDQVQIEFAQGAIDQIAPDVDAAENTNDFLMELYPESSDQIIIGDKSMEDAYDLYTSSRELEKEAKSGKQLAQNQMLEFMKDYQRVNFKKHGGSIIYRRSANSKPYFSVR